jgi:beta-glucosidase
MVVVVIASKPLMLAPSATGAAAVVGAGNPGMRGGRAIAEILLGPQEPSGRLPISFAAHAGQQPTYDNQVRGQHGDRSPTSPSGRRSRSARGPAARPSSTPTWSSRRLR